MSDFVLFCRSRDILIDSEPPVGVWRSFPTSDKPHKKNGRVKFMGDHGFAINWATMTHPDLWQRDKDAPPLDPAQLARIAKQQAESAAKRIAGNKEAARKAAAILGICQVGEHPYLTAKGFPEASGNVYAHRSGARLLVVPMRRGAHLVGLQFIDESGNKKFLEDQASRGAELVIDNKGVDVLCEGYATGLSIQAALQAARIRYRIHCCFSAFNITVIGQALREEKRRVIVVADNDPQHAGENAAQQVADAYWISKTVGNDFNDDHRARGLFAMSQDLKMILMKR